MTPLQIRYGLEQGPQDPKHLGRLYLFASASGLGDPFLGELQSSIEQRLHLDEPGFFALCDETSRWWQAKIDRMERLLLEQEVPSLFEKFVRSSARSGRMTSIQADVLLSRMLGMVLQKWSIQSGKNHLRRRDLSFFINQLRDPHHLKPTLPVLCGPVAMVWKGEWSATEEAYLERVIYLCSHCANYLEAASQDHPDQALLDSIKKVMIDQPAFSDQN